MPTTSPDNLYYADNTTPASLATITNTMANSVQDALDSRQARSYVWANSTARGAQTGMSTGDIGYQSDTEVYYRYSGAAWKIWSKALTQYSPTAAGFTSGSQPTMVFEYNIAAGRVHVTGKATLISTVSGQITFSTPTNFNIDTSYYGSAHGSQIGTGGVRDTNASTNMALGVFVNSATQMGISAYDISASYLRLTATTSTIPITWASTDIIYFTCSYPLA